MNRSIINHIEVILSLLALILAFSLVSCGSGGGEHSNQNTPDKTAPTLVSSNPANEATGVPYNTTTITFTFDEEMDTSSGIDEAYGHISKYHLDGTSPNKEEYITPVSKTWSADKKTYTVTVPMLGPNKKVEIYMNAFHDVAWNFYDCPWAENNMTFYTGEILDTTGPSVSKTIPVVPVSGITNNVSHKTAVSITFNEVIDPTLITTANFYLNKDTTVIEGNVTSTDLVISAATSTKPAVKQTMATFSPVTNLDFGAVYTATVTTGIKDLAGNPMAATYTMSFKTMDTPAAKIPDTGQTASYTNTFGEDSDYSINPMSFTDNGNGTVTDNVTGLMWPKNDDDLTHYWDWDDGAAVAAINYCQSLSLGGYADWRLPSIHELVSIVDYGKSSPAVNTTYFPNVKSAYYWFVEGEGFSLGGGAGTNYGGYAYYVLCVRGAQYPNPNVVDNGDETMTDVNTGLMWQKTGESQSNWEAAITYCENLTLATYTDWRMPNAKEAAMGRSATDTSTTNPGDGNYSVEIYYDSYGFYYADSGWSQTKSEWNAVSCVR